MVYPRLGHDVIIPAALAERVTLIDAPVIEISSTAVRQLIANGQQVKYYVPDDVEQYIINKNLYQHQDND